MSDQRPPGNYNPQDEIHNEGVIMEASVDDAEAIAKIHEESSLKVYPDEAHGINESDIESMELTSDEAVQKWKDRIEKQFGGGREQTFVYKENGKVLGFCKVIKGEKANVLSKLYVSPDAQTKGLGRSLLEKALQSLDDKDVILIVASYNNKAIRFYEKNGFKIDDVLWPYFMLGGKEGPEVALPSGKNIPMTEMVKKSVNNPFFISRDDPQAEGLIKYIEQMRKDLLE